MPIATHFPPGFLIRRLTPALLLTLAAPLAGAQADPVGFPAAAARFLEAELPPMEAAVAAQDRGFFEDAMARTVEFADQWGFKSRANPALAGYRACTDAVSDLVVVGLCRLTPGAADCTPQLSADFARNRAACQAQAGR